MSKKFTKRLVIKINEELSDSLQKLADRRGESKAEIVRRILEQALAEEAAADGKDVITSAVRSSMRDVMKPFEDRLAKISAKAAIAAATAMFLNTQCIADLGKNNAVELYQTARKKAVAYLREKDEDE